MRDDERSGVPPARPRRDRLRGAHRVGAPPRDGARLPAGGDHRRQPRFGDEAALLAWLDAGYHGELGYMARHGARRARPADLVPGTVRVVSVRMDYRRGGADPETVLGNPELGYVSRYALGRDYHRMIRRRLQRLADFIESEVGPFGYRAFADSAPVMEKPLARNAGLGWIGKHTNLLNASAGSWFFLGELYTDLPLDVDAPAKGPLRFLPRLHRCLSDRRDRRPVPARRAPVHLLPHHRAPRPDPRRAPPAGRQPHLRMRRLPARMPVEPLRRHQRRDRFRAAPRPRRRRPRRSVRVVARGLRGADARDGAAPARIRAVAAQHRGGARQRAGLARGGGGARAPCRPPLPRSCASTWRGPWHATAGPGRTGPRRPDAASVRGGATGRFGTRRTRRSDWRRAIRHHAWTWRAGRRMTSPAVPTCGASPCAAAGHPVRRAGIRVGNERRFVAGSKCG